MNDHQINLRLNIFKAEALTCFSKFWVSLAFTFTSFQRLIAIVNPHKSSPLKMLLEGFISHYFIWPRDSKRFLTQPRTGKFPMANRTASSTGSGKEENLASLSIPQFLFHSNFRNFLKKFTYNFPLFRKLWDLTLNRKYPTLRSLLWNTTVS